MTDKKAYYYFILILNFVMVHGITASHSNRLSHMNTNDILDVRIDPPNWFVGMEDASLHIMLHAPKISEYRVHLEGAEGISLDKITNLPNPNYVILECIIDENANAQVFDVVLTLNEKVSRHAYELKQKKATPQKIDGGDVLYLIMPDRFANGDPSLDDISSMREKSDRTFHGGKHGGDIRGVINHLDYLDDLGVTTIWLNPVYENDMEQYSYHGYSITDHYKVDPRLGDMLTYRELCDKAHQRGMKVIKDMIFNHIGSFHFWMEDLPDPNWVHQWEEFTRTNYSGATVTDPYASIVDRAEMLKGWFDTTMPDMNQSSPTLMKYLTQHSLWWIETAGIDGIRMDTYPYPEKNAMSTWVDAVLNEYPDFYIVGETWLYTPVQLAFWTKSNLKSDYQSNLPSVSDFGITWAIDKAFREEKGVWELYQILTNDFIYQTPNNNKIFVDNHDMERSFGVYEKDVDKFLMAYTFLLTTRGIPQYFYGTEIGMANGKPDGMMREDMPGGWTDDAVNVFTRENLSDTQLLILNYMQKLMTWRRSKYVFAMDNLVHFLPREELYVYGRRHENEAIVVIVNNSEQDRKLDINHYQELFESYQRGVEVLTDLEINDFKNIVVPAKKCFVIDLAE
jgi:glycosidase